MSQPLTDGIAQRIARYRKLNGWSAQRLADNTDGALSRASIANIESGRHPNISLNQFLAISFALRVPPVALLVDLEHPFEQTEIRFVGIAPRSLEARAPNVAIARWLAGGAGTATTPAAERVALVLRLLDDYLAARDALEAGQAVDRLRPPRPDHETTNPMHLREAAKRLEDAGISVPE